MRILFCSTGGAGHVLPLQPLAQAFVRLGHALAWATAPDAFALLRVPGLRAFAAGPGFAASRQAFRAAHPAGAALRGEALSRFTFPHLFGRVLAPAMLQDIEAAIAQWRPDLVVHEPACLAAPLACQARGVPHVAQGYGLCLPSGYLADAMALFGPHWQARGQPAPAEGGLYRHLYLHVVPERLQSAAQVPGRVAAFNPYRVAPAAAPLPQPLLRALQAARTPRVYLTFGTVFGAPALLGVAARAIARSGACVVVTLGPAGDPALLGALPPNVHAYPMLDHAALLSCVDAVVSHGGAGTVLGAAAHGLPQLVLPQAADHFRNAHALAAAQAALVLEGAGQTADAVAQAVHALPGATGAGAARLAADMAAMPDADAAARAVLAFAREAAG